MEKNLTPAVIENFSKVAIGDWVVVSYELREDRLNRNRRFIGEIIKVRNGKFVGKFVHPAFTRDHMGYVYQYPHILDITPFSFSQIVKKLAPSENYLRGLLLFRIHFNNL